VRSGSALDTVVHGSGESSGIPRTASRDNILAMYGKIAELTNGTYKVEVEPTFTDTSDDVALDDAFSS
jgi:hypothetical protein